MLEELPPEKADQNWELLLPDSVVQNLWGPLWLSQLKLRSSIRKQERAWFAQNH